MEALKPYVLSIAGFDPSGGAGILADIKTIEANGGYGFGVITAVTFQNDIAFEKISWLPLKEIIEQIKILQKRFLISYIKIGLIESLEILNELVTYLKRKDPNTVIVWDPIIKASAGFVFHQSVNKDLLLEVLKNIACITPNIHEATQLFGIDNLSEKLLSDSDNYYTYLKGGHGDQANATDIFFVEQQIYSFANPRLPMGEKHGSGCVLSAAFTTELAKGTMMKEAAKKANEYTFGFLASNETLLGYHSYNITHEKN